MFNRDNLYFRQVTLIIELLPLIKEEACFALKGGTAINLFVRDLPRLSVDIDLTYLEREERHPALVNIATALGRVADRVDTTLLGVSVTRLTDRQAGESAETPI